MPWTFAAAAVGAGFSYLSKRKDRKAQQRALDNPQALGVDYKKLRDEASAAGFNPLTALQMGGSASYTRQYAPVLTREDPGQFFQTMAGAIQQKFDNRIVSDRLQLDRDYFGLERQKFDHLKQQGYALSNVSAYGSPFGPSASMEQHFPDMPSGPSAREVGDELGAVAGMAYGINRSLETAKGAYRRVGSAFAKHVAETKEGKPYKAKLARPMSGGGTNTGSFP